MKNATARKAAPKAAPKAVIVTPIATVNVKDTSQPVPDLVACARAYKGLIVKAKNNLVVLKDIGIVLNIIRGDFESDKLYGKHIATTELKIMSKNDRSDAQWLAEKWDAICAFKAKKNIESNSVTYLRKLMNKAAKASTTDTKPATKGEKGKGKAGNGTETKSLDCVQLAEMFMELCATNSVDPEMALVTFNNAVKATRKTK